YYLEKSIAYFPEVIKRDKDQSLIKIIKEYEQSKTLPVPKELNFINSFYDTNLEERLVLLNIRTEAPAVARLKAKIASPFCRNYPEIAESFFLDKIDETSHGSIGYKWLKFLYPETEKRKKIIEEIDLSRGLFLKIALAENNHIDFFELLKSETTNYED
uniref:hypothetical protein n=1 Tax=Umezakia ovalisporum TaxID=75695 RepID=UPI0039C6ACE9